jgi:hypothetical protein
MNLEIGTETPIFLFWEYLFQIFGNLSLQCTFQVFILLGQSFTNKREIWRRGNKGMERIRGKVQGREETVGKDNRRGKGSEEECRNEKRKKRKIRWRKEKEEEGKGAKRYEGKRSGRKGREGQGRKGKKIEERRGMKERGAGAQGREGKGRKGKKRERSV